MTKKETKDPACYVQCVRVGAWVCLPRLYFSLTQRRSSCCYLYAENSNCCETCLCWRNWDKSHARVRTDRQRERNAGGFCLQRCFEETGQYHVSLRRVTTLSEAIIHSGLSCTSKATPKILLCVFKNTHTHTCMRMCAQRVCNEMWQATSWNCVNCSKTWKITETVL